MPSCGARTRTCRVETRLDTLAAGEPDVGAKRRQECRRGTHECVRHGGSPSSREKCELITWFPHNHWLLRSQKNLRRDVLRLPFRTGMTAHAHPLLSLAGPKPALLGRNGLPRAVQ